MAAKLGCHPILMVKAMLRYRWMVSYLTAAHMVDRHTMGLRGKELRYAHNQFFSVLHNSVLGVRDIIIRDKNLRPNSKHAAKLRENTVMFDEMTPHLIMMGFPTVKWIDIAMFAIGLPVGGRPERQHVLHRRHGAPRSAGGRLPRTRRRERLRRGGRLSARRQVLLHRHDAVRRRDLADKHPHAALQGASLVPDHAAAACQRTGGADLCGQEPEKGHRISRAAVRRQMGLGRLLEKRRNVQRELALYDREVGRQLHRAPTGLRRGAGTAARI